MTRVDLATKADLAADDGASAALTAHEADTTAVHGIADTANLVYTSDGRLTNARTPSAHKASHATGGSDPLSPADIGAPALDGSGKIRSADLQTIALPIVASGQLQLGTIVKHLILFARHITKLPLLLDVPPCGADVTLQVRYKARGSDETVVTNVTFTAMTDVVKYVTVDIAAADLSWVILEITQIGTTFPGQDLFGHFAPPDAVIPGSLMAAPGAPVISASVDGNIGSVNIVTAATGSFDKYLIYRDDGAGPVFLGILKKGFTTFTDTTISGTNTVIYSAYAKNEERMSARSNLITINSPLFLDTMDAVGGTLDPSKWITFLGATSPAPGTNIVLSGGLFTAKSGTTGSFSTNDILKLQLVKQPSNQWISFTDGTVLVIARFDVTAVGDLSIYVRGSAITLTGADTLYQFKFRQTGQNEMRKRSASTSTLLATKTITAFDITKFYNILVTVTGSTTPLLQWLTWEVGTTKPSTTPSDQKYTDTAAVTPVVAGPGGCAISVGGGNTAGVYNQVTIDNVRVDGT